MFQPSRIRLFFALQPPIRLARQIASAAEWSGRGAVAAERLHLTLFILDDFLEPPAGVVDGLFDMGARIDAAPFEVTLDVIAGNGRSVALRPRLRNEGFASLYRQLRSLAPATGVAERQGYRSSPHLTLGYRDGAPFTEQIASVSWRAESVALIRSHLGQSRHELLGRWPLAGKEEAQPMLF